MSSPRYSTNERASVEVFGQKNNVEAVLKNISNTGARIEWFQEGVSLLKGDVVCMTVKLNQLASNRIVHGEVVWRRGNSSGINFIDSKSAAEAAAKRLRPLSAQE
jgi:PilZ domain